MKLAVIGDSKFTVGFELTGIRDTYEADESTVLKIIKEIEENKEIGIVVIEQRLLDSIESHEREQIEESVEPVFIPLSVDATQDSLRKLIKKSIGVDLWKGENDGK